MLFLGFSGFGDGESDLDTTSAADSLVASSASTPTGTPSANQPVIQRIEVKAIATWKLMLAGVVTGASIALGNYIFSRTLKRFGGNRAE